MLGTSLLGRIVMFLGPLKQWARDRLTISDFNWHHCPVPPLFAGSISGMQIILEIIRNGAAGCSQSLPILVQKSGTEAKLYNSLGELFSVICAQTNLKTVNTKESLWDSSFGLGSAGCGHDLLGFGSVLEAE